MTQVGVTLVSLLRAGAVHFLLHTLAHSLGNFVRMQLYRL